MKISHLRQAMQEHSFHGSPRDIIPGDVYQELEMDSRFVDCHHDVSHPHAPVNLHSHNFYELLYCTNTCGAEYLVGADRYRLQKGDIVMIPPGISHRPLLPEVMTQPYERQVLWIHGELMKELLLSFPELRVDQADYSTLLRTAGTRWEYLGELFQNCLREAQHREDCWELALVGHTVNLLTHLHRAFLDQSFGALKAEKPELLDRVMAYVEEHLAEKITIAQVAHHFYVSESTISQIFRKKMDVSFYRCVTQRRLIAAKSLMEKGHLLEDIAARTGFADYSGFYRAFKQEYGISPRQYRRLQETNGRHPMG